LIKNIIHKGYWPIYGEMKIFDDLKKENCDENQGSFTQSIGVEFSYIALMIYMLIANFLVIDLLIVMFR
jgi:hypothetical protein